jgi:phosphoribosylglycinamide formyltransferase-1
VGEGIVPDDVSFDAAEMATGAPGLPRSFSWRGTRYRVLEVLEKWKERGDCRHGSSERYVRKHWYRVKTAEGPEMKIYFERQQRSSGGSRWRLYCIRE